MWRRKEEILKNLKNFHCFFYKKLEEIFEMLTSKKKLSVFYSMQSSSLTWKSLKSGKHHCFLASEQS